MLVRAKRHETNVSRLLPAKVSSINSVRYAKKESLIKFNLSATATQHETLQRKPRLLQQNKLRQNAAHASSVLFMQRKQGREPGTANWRMATGIPNWTGTDCETGILSVGLGADN